MIIFVIQLQHFYDICTSTVNILHPPPIRLRALWCEKSQDSVLSSCVYSYDRARACIYWNECNSCSNENNPMLTYHSPKILAYLHIIHQRFKYLHIIHHWFKYLHVSFTKDSNTCMYHSPLVQILTYHSPKILAYHSYHPPKVQILAYNSPLVQILMYNAPLVQLLAYHSS